MSRDLLTAKEAAHLLSVTTRTVSRLVESGDLVEAYKLDGIRGPRLFYRRDVQRLAAARKAAS
jgi:excisionase family DNA binding protein